MRARRLVLALVALAALACAPLALATEPASGHGVEHATGGGEHAAAGEEHGGEHAGPPWAAIIVNFVIFAGVLAYFLGRPAKAFFAERGASIVASLTAAERARAEAQAKLAEIEARLAEVETQAKGILDDAARQAQAERERIVAAAAEDARRILAQAEARVGEMEGAAQRRLRALASDLAVETARDLIAKNVTAEDRSRALDRNLKALQSQS